MENKYFTPEIEDLHVGYECEWRMKKVNGIKYHTSEIYEWQPHILKIEDFSDNDLADEFHNVTYNLNEFRTPYLTKEQIEQELSNQNIFWDYGRNDEYYTEYELTEFKSIWFSNYDVTDLWIRYINANNGKQNDVPFKIKSINEFRKLIKMLEI